MGIIIKLLCLNGLRSIGNRYGNFYPLNIEHEAAEGVVRRRDRTHPCVHERAAFKKAPSWSGGEGVVFSIRNPQSQSQIVGGGSRFG
jgi:hypothetical protein